MRKVLFLLLAAGTLLPAAGLITMAQGGDSPQSVVTMLSGGHYRLVSPDGAANMIAGGGAYLLWELPSPELRGSGCCCTYLPCVLRDS